MRKKWMSLLLVAAMVVTACTQGTGETAQNKVAEGSGIGDDLYKNPVVSEKEVPIYYNSLDNEDTVSLAFLNDNDDLPYISLDAWKDVLIKIHREGYNDDNQKDLDYNIELSTDGDEAVYTRDNSYTLTFDFAKDTMDFLDFDGFFQASNQTDLITLAELNDSDDDILKYEKVLDGYNRYGKEIVLNLADYDIHLIKSKDQYYAPLQTLGDFLISMMYINVFYNGKEVMITSSGNFKDDETNELSEMGDVYYAEQKEERSEALSEFSYNELCLVMDSLYGLKEIHGIDRFDDLFVETGLKYRLTDPDPSVADEALFELIDLHLDDLHSSFDYPSWMVGEPSWSMERYGTTYNRFITAARKYLAARREYYPDGCPGYEEVGNTAYITFDHFLATDDDVDYYGKDTPSEDSEDTIGLLIYAYEQIMRKGSPVENVVMDLSNNLGGSATTAVYAIGMFLGESTDSIENSFSGARMTNYYALDTNLDGKFNKKDTLAGKGLKFYCLISPVSFSCGNLVPCVFKYSDEVTLLGKTSGGGACAVLPLSTAYGTAFSISGYIRLSYSKNGAFYDIDQGAEPDYIISDPKNFYDRKALTDYINGLY